MIKECKHHGKTEFILENRGYYRCRICRSECVTKRRKQLKKDAVAYKGGKCVLCGYDKCVAALDFHHKDDNKEFGISLIGVTRSWEKIKKEIDKCILVCANCHRELHYQIADPVGLEPTTT